MKKVGLMLMSLVLVVSLFAGCGKKMTQVEAGYQPEELEAVLVSKVSSKNPKEPEIKVVVDESQIKTVVDAAGKINYNKDKSAGNDRVNDDNADIVVMIFIPKAGKDADGNDKAAKLVGYINDGKKTIVILNKGDRYIGGGDSPVAMFDGLTDQTDKAAEQGVDLIGAYNAIAAIN